MTTTSALSSSPAVPSRTARATAQDLGAFVTASPSAFHAVQETARRLREAGFTPLPETDHWSAQDVTGDRYVIRGGSNIAWSTPRGAGGTPAWRTGGSHTRSRAAAPMPDPRLRHTDLP